MQVHHMQTLLGLRQDAVRRASEDVLESIGDMDAGPSHADTLGSSRGGSSRGQDAGEADKRVRRAPEDVLESIGDMDAGPSHALGSSGGGSSHGQDAGEADKRVRRAPEDVLDMDAGPSHADTLGSSGGGSSRGQDAGEADKRVLLERIGDMDAGLSHGGGSGHGQDAGKADKRVRRAPEDVLDMDAGPSHADALRSSRGGSSRGQDAGETDKRVRRAREDVLLEKIISATQGKNLSDSQNLFELPFPFLGAAPPERFEMQGHGEERSFKYMGRTGYANFRDVVLGLYPEERYHELGTLPVSAKSNGYDRAALWGTMGSGKSYMLAALACDLIASFNSSSQGKQRVVYIPDCELLLSRYRVRAFENALRLSYADDIDALSRISAIRHQESALKEFFEAELERNVCIYLILDQFNAVEFGNDDSAPVVAQKGVAFDLISELAACQLLITSATANNTNSKKWYSKQLNVTPVFLHGGLDDEEYKSWKTHFKSLGDSATCLKQLDGEDELRVKDATGRVPLFLKQWSEYTDTADMAWQRFIKMKEVNAAKAHLELFIVKQLEGGEAVQQIYRKLYLQLLTGGEVNAIPEMYDCRYVYVKDGFGRCVCGMYRDFIAEILQENQHFRLTALQWKAAIARETSKEHPNYSILGFMIEQHMIANMLRNGIPLYGTEVMKCTEVQYFKSGSEVQLDIIEGCILYVPDAFNYKRVDAIVRRWIRSTEPIPTMSEGMLKMYRKLPLQVAGVQITIGALQKHLSSESNFCSPRVMEAWYEGWNREDVGRFFIWYALQSELDQHACDAEMLSPCMYANREIRARTRAGHVEELAHITIFFALEDYEPLLKNLRNKAFM